MPATLIIEGAAGLMKVAAGMTVASKGLKREVRMALKEACKPVVTDIKGKMMAERLPAQWTPGAGGGAAGGGAKQRTQATLGRRKKPVSEKSMRRIEANSGLRQMIASGIGVNVGLNPNSPFVKIKVGTGKLPQDQKGLPRAIEKGRWRHPVYGRQGVWVQQKGYPYFYNTIRAAVPAIEAKVALVAAEFVQRSAKI